VNRIPPLDVTKERDLVKLSFATYNTSEHLRSLEKQEYGETHMMTPLLNILVNILGGLLILAGLGGVFAAFFVSPRRLYMIKRSRTRTTYYNQPTKNNENERASDAAFKRIN